MSNDVKRNVEQLSLNFGGASESKPVATQGQHDKTLVPFVDMKTQLLRREAIDRVKRAGIFSLSRSG